jgi:hypothetical protein
MWGEALYLVWDTTDVSPYDQVKVGATWHLRNIFDDEKKAETMKLVYENDRRGCKYVVKIEKRYVNRECLRS